MKESFYSPEKKDRAKGENVKLNVFVIRHGQKEYQPDNNDTGLTESGIKQAKEFGAARKSADMIKAYYSPTKRTKDTADSVVLSSELPSGETRLRKELEFSYELGGKFDQMISQFKKEAIGDDILSPKELDERVINASNGTTNYFISFDDKRPEDPTANSPLEVSSRIAKLLLHYVEMSKRLNSDSSVDLINVTHDLNIAAFIKYVLDQRAGTQNNFKIELLGGPIGYTEGFEITIDRQDLDNLKLTLSFRGSQYDIDEQSLRNLAEAEYEK